MADIIYPLLSSWFFDRVDTWHMSSLNHTHPLLTNFSKIFWILKYIMANNIVKHSKIFFCYWLQQFNNLVPKTSYIYTFSCIENTVYTYQEYLPSLHFSNLYSWSSSFQLFSSINASNRILFYSAYIRR